MRLEDLGHGLAVVPDAFCLPQSHNRSIISYVSAIYSTEAGGNLKGSGSRKVALPARDNLVIGQS